MTQPKTPPPSKARFKNLKATAPSRVISRIIGNVQGDQTTPTLRLDERDLIIPVSGGSGGPPEIQNVRVRSLDVRRMEELLVGRDDLPFKTKSDLLRACIHLGISLLEGATIQRGVFKVAGLIENLSFRELENARFGEVLKQLHSVVDANLDIGAEATARRLVLEAKKALDGMNPEQKKIFGEKIDRMFKHVLKAGQPSLEPSKMGSEGEDGDVVEWEEDGDGDGVNWEDSGE